MKVISTLPRFIKFGTVEVAPNENNFNEADTKLLKSHKGFQNYVNDKSFSIEAPKKATAKTKEG